MTAAGFSEQPCPSCGRCPTCGRGGYVTWPYYPTPWIWWSATASGATTNITIQGDDGSTGGSHERH